jgi:hypoxanthine phosphoribosyltransferase
LKGSGWVARSDADGSGHRARDTAARWDRARDGPARIAPGYPVPMTEPAKDVVSWSDLDRLVGALASRVRPEAYDVMLAITRGGLVPAGMLAYRLGIRNILIAAVAYYDDAGRPAERPTFLQFPADPLLHGQRVLIVDEVWDTGTTIEAVIERVRQAGGAPTTAVLHYKPTRSRVPSVPDHHVVETERWVVYPFKAGR